MQILIYLYAFGMICGFIFIIIYAMKPITKEDTWSKSFKEPLLLMPLVLVITIVILFGVMLF